MIDLLVVLTRGGVELWRTALVDVEGDPVDTLVRSVLLEERKGEAAFRLRDHTLKWCFDNENDLIFVAAYLTLSNLTYVDDLLQSVRKEFCAAYKDTLASLPLPSELADFGPRYEKILDRYERRRFVPVVAKKSSSSSLSLSAAKSVAVDGAASQQQPQAEQPPPQEQQQPKAPSEAVAPASGEAASPGGDGGGGLVASADEEDGDRANTDEAEEEVTMTVGRQARKPRSFAESRKNVDAMAKKATAPKQDEPADDGPAPAAAKGKAPRGFQPKAAKASPAGKPAPPKKPVRYDANAGAPAETELDFSREDDKQDDAARRVLYMTRDGQKPDDPSALYASDEDDDNDDADDADDAGEDGAAAGEKKGGRGVFGFLSSFVSGQVLDAAAVEPALEQMKMMLMGKNVAADIAEKLCESVSASLVGTKIGALTTVRGTVRRSVEEALTRILTPKKSTDLLQGVLRARSEGRPYVIVMVGVNGVGKSTSLAKLCAYLLNKQFTVSIAACDTFRSGAVEQLRTHATCLGVPLFEQGYNKDAAAVASSAIREAKSKHYDVVLVDTAGRMQDNEPLMRALSKLININKPDLTLFVGEALVGNDAVDQLTKFNQALADLSPGEKPQLVDGIVLTKFDTVDDNVGAAISMTYTTGMPIMFVGVGQTYSDLKRMNVKLLIKKLLK